MKNLLPYVYLMEDLNDALDAKSGETILDAGCGPGLMIEKVIKESRATDITITGVDVDKRMIQAAGKRCQGFPNVKLAIADLNGDLKFADSFFDKVLCSNTLYALDNPRKAVSELHRVLKPGGVLVIANPKPSAEQKALIRGHVAAINRLTPIRRRARYIIASILLIPVYLLLMAINRIILEKGRTREYHFLHETELRALLQRTGFTNITIGSCYVDQDWLVKAEKQTYSG